MRLYCINILKKNSLCQKTQAILKAKRKTERVKVFATYMTKGSLL